MYDLHYNHPSTYQYLNTYTILFVRYACRRHPACVLLSVEYVFRRSEEEKMEDMFHAEPPSSVDGEIFPHSVAHATYRFQFCLRMGYGDGRLFFSLVGVAAVTKIDPWLSLVRFCTYPNKICIVLLSFVFCHIPVRHFLSYLISRSPSTSHLPPAYYLFFPVSKIFPHVIRTTKMWKTCSRTHNTMDDTVRIQPPLSNSLNHFLLVFQHHFL